jgi:hypothetical protein
MATEPNGCYAAVPDRFNGPPADRLGADPWRSRVVDGERVGLGVLERVDRRDRLGRQPWVSRRQLRAGMRVVLQGFSPGGTVRVRLLEGASILARARTEVQSSGAATVVIRLSPRRALRFGSGRCPRREG